MPKAQPRPSLRDLVVAEERKAGRKSEIEKWLDTLDQPTRDEVLILLDDRTVAAAAVYRVIRDHLGYRGAPGNVTNWRNRARAA